MSTSRPEDNGEAQIQRIENEMSLHRERYAAFRESTEPLTPQRLAEIMGVEGVNLMESEYFETILDKIAWPYEGDEEVEGKLDCNIGNHGPGTFAEVAVSDKGLNNFHTCLRLKPYHLHRGSEQIKNLTQFAFATKPCLIRAYEVAPQLFDLLRDFEQGELSRGLRIPTVHAGESHNETVMEAYATAYSLMQRLMMSHDSEKQLHLLNQATEDADPIKNASEELWT